MRTRCEKRRFEKAGVRKTRVRESAPCPRALTAAQAAFLRRLWWKDKGLGVPLRMADRLTVSTWTLGMIDPVPAPWSRRPDTMRYRLTHSGRLSVRIHVQCDMQFATLPLCCFEGRA